jgi:hypothetical protein
MSSSKSHLVQAGRLVGLPSLIYFVLFVLYTFPLIRRFSTHFFADAGDGLQNVWNMWWVNKAIIELLQNPWHTNFLHYPYGISLLGHTLNPFNGLIGIPMQRVLSLTQAHNVVIIFSFVAAGVTTFLLAYYLTRAYWPSLIAGFIFSFSPFHFAHAEGHMQMVALEWIPLFLLFWIMLLTRPSVRLGLAAALALFLVLLCDYYYFLYTVLTAFIFLVWFAIRQRDALFLFKESYRAPLLAFLVSSLVISGVQVFALVWLQITDPLLAIYVPEQFSLDLLAPFIPGGHWRFAELTEVYWSRLPGNIHESSVYLGWSVIVVLVYVLLKRRQAAMPTLSFWYFLLFFFAIMSLGPVLNIWGSQVPVIKLPYDLVFQRLFPPLRVARVPVRMMVMVYLSAAVISGVGFKLLFQQTKRMQILAGLLLVLLAIEYLPKPLPETRILPPDYITLLRDLPGDDAVADIATQPPVALYYQTIYEKPMALGYVSRVPTSTEAKDLALMAVIEEGRYPDLCRQYGFRYLLAWSDRDVLSTDPSIQVLYDQGNIWLYDLGAGAPCEIVVAAGKGE